MSAGSGRVRLDVHVQPGSSRPAVGGTRDGALVVRVAERAVDGRATAAALAAVATAVGVPRRAVTLARGATSRRKVVEIDVPPAEADRVGAAIDRLLRGDGP